MLENEFLQIGLFFLVIILCVHPLGWYVSRIFEKKPVKKNPSFGRLELLVYRFCNINYKDEMTWKKYLRTLLIFNIVGFIFLYLIQRFQAYLPLNPQNFANVEPALAFNTAVSFITNTDWQAYSPENSLSYFTQTIGLTVQNFLSAATGLALLMAFIRGIVRHETELLGNFWVDLTRGILYLFLPFALILAILLSSQGVIQNFKPYQKITLINPISYQVTSNGTLQNEIENQQIIPMGPAASQIAIKQLGTNGGGFFNTNSAHPFENPTPLSNFFEMIAILLIPAALCSTFGILVKDRRQGWAIFIAMLLICLPLCLLAVYCEQKGNPLLNIYGVDQTAQVLCAGGNMEGKETRFGIVNAGLWAALTTATSNGSVNAMLDSFTPLGGLVPLWLMHLGEVIFGGVGSGLYVMLQLVIITVFVAGLMVGRTPEYLGKKIEPFEVKMASFSVLLMPMTVLVLTALAMVTQMGVSSIKNPGVHGFTEILYAFTSMGNNNGSAFSGLNANTPFYNIAGGCLMLLLRFWIAISTLAIAGSLARKKLIPISSGTMLTHTPLFIFLLIGVTLLLGTLTFFPTLALGPIIEHLTLWGHYGN